MGGSCCGVQSKLEWEGFEMKLSPRELEMFGRSALLIHRPLAFAVLRTIILCFWITLLMLDLTDEIMVNAGPWYLIYISVWTAYVELLFFVFACVTTWKTGVGTIDFKALNDSTKATPPWLQRITWTLYNISFPGSAFVFVLYWLLVYKGSPQTIHNITLHGTNFALMLVDSFLSNIPFRLAHMYQFISYGVVYAILLIIQAYANVDNGPRDGTLAYKVIDLKRNPGFAYPFLVVIALILMPMFSLIVWGIKRSMIKLQKACGLEDPYEDTMRVMGSAGFAGSENKSPGSSFWVDKL
mmetsp:Transcript_11000/g.26998  ORF Transcript_11000/g.26998 Transcript_11000/m.26998 type:complete len:297 (+) Transcript_11000:57-947(+)